MDWDTYATRYRQIDDQERIPPLLDGYMGSASGRALDMGCGEGALLTRLSQAYEGKWELTGFEVSAFRADIARGLGHEVLVDEGGLVPSPSESFDLVISTHVIEHTPDDHAYAAELFRLVRPGGYVYVETPVKLRGAWYFRRSPTAGWVLDPTHIREYRSAAAVNAVLVEAGLTVESERLTNVAFPLVAADSLLRRALKRPQRTGQPRGLLSKKLPIPRYRIQGVLAQRPLESS